MPPDLSIGQLSDAARVPVTTLRYYDRIGLLPATRLSNSHRRYPESTLGRLRLIQLCQGLGCSLEEVAVVLAPGAGQARRDLARAKLAEVDSRLAQLRGARAILDHLAGCDHGVKESEECRRTTTTAYAAVVAGSATTTPAREGVLAAPRRTRRPIAGTTDRVVATGPVADLVNEQRDRTL